ncbi:hypothetical protein ABPG74_004521 [Tetrahymena malaccensis]
MYHQDNYPYDAGFNNNNQHQNIAYSPLQYGQNQKVNTPDEAKVEKLLLVITWVSIFNCIMKMDYNVAIYLFLYYIWVTRTTSSHYKAFLLANAVFIGLDILWFLINVNSWGSGFEDQKDLYATWLSFRLYRIFTLTISAIIILLKIALALFQYKAYSATLPKVNPQFNPANPGAVGGQVNHPGANPNPNAFAPQQNYY